MKVQVAGTAKLGERGDVRLPDTVLAALGWRDDDSLLVEIADGDRVILSRRPKDVAEHTAGALTHLYPEPGDVGRFLEEERAEWDGFDRRFDD